MVQVQLIVALSMADAIWQMLKIQKDHHSPMKFANDLTLKFIEKTLDFCASEKFKYK